MITTEEITKSYGRNLVLRGITFCAAAGENHVARRSERSGQKHDDKSAGRVDSSE